MSTDRLRRFIAKLLDERILPVYMIPEGQALLASLPRRFTLEQIQDACNECGLNLEFEQISIELGGPLQALNDQAQELGLYSGEKP